LAAALDALGRQDEAMVTCDEVVRRFGDTPEPDLREQVSNARKQKARIMNELGRPESGGQ
jgi:hypothetical protein